MKHYRTGSSDKQQLPTPRRRLSLDEQTRATRPAYWAHERLAERKALPGNETEIVGFMVGFQFAMDVAIHAPELAQWWITQIRREWLAEHEDATPERLHQEGEDAAREFAGYVAQTGVFAHELAEVTR